jgi:hypothetical protein
MDEEGQRWVLKALREAGDELIDQFYGASEDELCGRPEDDEWSLKEIAGHLRDNEELALEQDYRSADVQELLSAFAGFRRQAYRLLSSLAPDDWERCGRHPYRGEVTIAQIARELAEHDLGHLWQARRLREALGRGRERPSR